MCAVYSLLAGVVGVLVFVVDAGVVVDVELDDFSVDALVVEVSLASVVEVLLVSDFGEVVACEPESVL